MKKIIFIIILFLSCYIVYNLTISDSLDYVTLGDSLSKGVNVYGIKQYGYSDYIKDYLEQKNKLASFDNTFTDSNYRITDLLNMIEYNEVKNVNGEDVSINRLLKKADVITLSIGMNELYYKLEMNDSNIYNYMNGILRDMEQLLEHINKYNHKKVFVLGYYNIGDYQEEINYINVKLKNIVSNEGFEYVDLANIIDNFIPNNYGYLKISKIILAKLEKY